MCPGKPENSFDLMHFDTHFIALSRNPTVVSPRYACTCCGATRCGLHALCSHAPGLHTCCFLCLFLAMLFFFFFTGKTPAYSLRCTPSDTFSLISSSWRTSIYLNSLINLFPLLLYKLFIFAFLTCSELSDVQWEPNNICWMN